MLFNTEYLNVVMRELAIIHTWTCTAEHVEHDYVLGMVSNGPLVSTRQARGFRKIVPETSRIAAPTQNLRRNSTGSTRGLV
jgi:hypothetical protein